MKSLVRHLMRTDVIAVDASTPFKTVAQLLTEARVSALPVLDEARRVVGVVSEADLLLKEEHPDAGLRAPPLESRQHRSERRKAAAATAGELMTAPAVTVSPLATAAEAARRMHAAGVKRLPVVDGYGRLVGIIGRADVLGVFARPDDDIRREVEEEVIGRDFALDPKRLVVRVADGVVTLEGNAERHSLLPLLLRAVHGVEGVVRVDDRLTFASDDREPTVMTYPWLRPIPRACPAGSADRAPTGCPATAPAGRSSAGRA